MRYPWAQPGRRVICIDDNWERKEGDRWVPARLTYDPVKGEAYTIQFAYEGDDGIIYIHLTDSGCPIGGYQIDAFKPATDISIFHKILERAPVDGELEDA